MPKQITRDPEHERAVLARLRILDRMSRNVAKAMDDLDRIKPEWTPRLSTGIEKAQIHMNLGHALDNISRIVRYIE